MLLSDPHVLILDEPTNHLDLPSIEELEQALSAYKGAIIYISHDSYFAKKLGGETVAIGS
jgi:ATPase subunit of ABC transporter with duplicated ATPase domains